MLLPIISTSIYFAVGKPKALIILGGVAQALLLPMIAFAALHFRHKTCDPALRPGRAWDCMLIVCLVLFISIGLYLAFTTVTRNL